MNTCFSPSTDHSLPSTAASSLDNPRHEAFALALAVGETPAGAYDAVGFHPKNRKSRAEALSQQPDIVARVKHLVARVKHLVENVPNLVDLWRTHALNFYTMPEPSGRETASEAARRVRTRVASPKQTPRRMNGWLWQVINGRRKIDRMQMQAVRLYVRLNHWDRAPKKGDAPTAPVLRLVPPGVVQSLDLINNVYLTYENQFNGANLMETEYESDCADADALNQEAEAAAAADSENVVRPSPGGPHVPAPDPQNIPMGTNGDQSSNHHSLEPQPSNPEFPENNDKNKASPSDRTLALQSRAEPIPDASANNRPSPEPSNLEPPNLNPSLPDPSDRTLALQGRAETTPDSHIDHLAARSHGETTFPSPVPPITATPPPASETAHSQRSTAHSGSAARRTVHPKLQPGETLAPGIKGNLNKGRLEPNLGDDGVWFGPSIYPKDPPKSPPPFDDSPPFNDQRTSLPRDLRPLQWQR
ncbi:MAG: hypothetical protein U0984_13355 [Prosthecobacter sp.]|nr:hypothetical protein [Prosthecobacter sp.]